MSIKPKVALVGFGRIGRAIFRINSIQQRFDIVAINDINPEIGSMAYLLRYDSVYGRFEKEVMVEEDHLIVDGQMTRVFHNADILELPWERMDIDLVIEASGNHPNVIAAPILLQYGIKKVVITHSPKEVDQTLILGANHEDYTPEKSAVISSSICDAVAVAPVLRLLDTKMGIKQGFLTTLHPWLSYQNLLDGPSTSWAIPHTLYPHYALGRASPGSLIPKPTSAIEATARVLPHVTKSMRCMSFRIPTSDVGVANLYLQLKQKTSIEEIIDIFKEAEASQMWKIFKNNVEPLVPLDPCKTSHVSILTPFSIMLFTSGSYFGLGVLNRLRFSIINSVIVKSSSQSRSRAASPSNAKNPNFPV